MTFDSLDSIGGGGGNDTLNISANGAGTFQASSITDVEAINLNASVANAFVSLLGATGVTSITSSGSSALGGFSNIGSTAVGLAVSNSSAGATFTHANSAVSGSADAATLALSNVPAGTITVQPTSGTNGIETLNIVSSGAANLVTVDDGTSTSLSKIVVTGGQNLTLTTTPTSVATVDASALTGVLTYTVNSAGAAKVTGGSGADNLTLGQAVADSVSAGAGADTITFTGNFTNADTVDGGADSDTLVVVAADVIAYSAPTTATLTNVESLNISDAFDGSVAGSTFTVATLSSGISALTLAAGTSATNAADDTIVGGAGTFSVVVSGGALADVLTVTDTGTATTDVLNLSNTRSTAATDVFAGKDIAITGYETVNLAVGSGNGAQTLGVVTLAADTGGTTALNITGSNSLSTGIITAGTINASGLTGTAAFTMGAAAASVTSITGSPNADTLIGDSSSSINGGAGNDVITGGSGNDTLIGDTGDDTITTNAGSDSVNGGAGNDTIVFAANFGLGDSVDGGAGTDVLSISNTAVGALHVLSISAANTINSNLTDIERVTVSDAFDLGAAFDLARLKSVNYVTLTGGTTGAEELSGVVNNSTIVVGDDSTLTATLADATGSSDAITFALVDLDGTASNETVTGLTTSGIETVNITVNEATADSTLRTYTLTTATFTNVTSVVVSGTESLTITGSTNITNLNASGLTAGLLNVSVANAAVGATVVGGAGDDVITGSANSDSISGGAGIDSIVGGALNDTIDGGAGADILIGGTGIDSITGGDGADVIIGGAGNDIIILTEGTAASDRIAIGRSDVAGTDLAMASTNLQTVTGFTAGTGGDVLSFDIGAIVVSSATEKVATLSADGATLTSLVNSAVATDIDVLIVLGTYGSYAAVQATMNATASLITDNTNGAVVVWRDGSGNTRVFFDTDISAGAGTGTELATLVGVNTASLVAGNFDVVATGSAT